MSLRVSSLAIFLLIFVSCIRSGPVSPTAGSTTNRSDGGGERGPGPEGNGGGYGTMLTLENGRVRCGYSARETQETYEVVCHILASVGGSDVPPSPPPPGFITWSDLTLVAGEPLLRSKCSTENHDLTRICEVTVSGQARVEVSATFRDAGKEKTEADQVLLPFEVVTFGLGLESLFRRPLVRDGSNRFSLLPGRTRASGPVAPPAQGVQNLPKDPLAYALTLPRSVCHMNGVTYYSEGAFVIRQTELGATVLVGSSNHSPEDYSAPTRLSLGDWDTAELDVDCEGGYIYITNPQYNRILRVSEDGTEVKRIAGVFGELGFSGDGGPATEALLGGPSGIDALPDGTIYFADAQNSRIRKVSPSGIITTVAGRAQHEAPYFSGDGGPATNAQLNFPQAVRVDTDGTFYIADSQNQRVRRVTPDGIITTFAGTTPTPNSPSTPPWGLPAFGGDGGPATEARLNRPSALHISKNGALYIADSGNGRIRRVGRDGIIATFVASLNNPRGIAEMADGAFLIAETQSNRIRKVSTDKSLSTTAGNGQDRFSGDGGPAEFSQFKSPQAVAIDLAGNLYISDSLGHRIRKISAAGIITTLAGNGLGGFSGDGGQGNGAQINTPGGIAVDLTGNVYFADRDNHRVRRIAADGVITTVAGTGEVGFSGDGGPATLAKLNTPLGIAIGGPDASLYITEKMGNRIRRVWPSGMITTLAGNGELGFSGDGGPATQASLYYPEGVAVDPEGVVYIADATNLQIRRVDRNGIITSLDQLPIAREGTRALRPRAVTRSLLSTSPEPQGTPGAQPGAPQNEIFPIGIALMGRELYVVDGRTGMVHSFVSRGDAFLPSPFFGGLVSNASDCAASVSGSGTQNEWQRLLLISLASVCSGNVTGIAIASQCNPQNNTLVMAFTQQMAGSANVVRVTVPCTSAGVGLSSAARRKK